MAPRACAAAQDNAVWQRRLHAALGDILCTRPDLAPISWQLPPSGCTLAGLIDGPDRYLVERTFAEWQVSLGLKVIVRRPDVLRAARTRRDRVRVLLIALLPEPPRRDTP